MERNHYQKQLQLISGYVSICGAKCYTYLNLIPSCYAHSAAVLVALANLVKAVTIDVAAPFVASIASWLTFLDLVHYTEDRR